MIVTNYFKLLFTRDLFTVKFTLFGALIFCLASHYIYGQAYDEWYLQTEDKAAQLFIREIGEGPKVVVLHGGPGMPHDYLLDICKGLTDKFRFVFYDQRGSRSSPIYKDSATIQKHVEDLESIRKALGIEKLKLVAHSAGTYLFYNYLAKYPENVENVVLIGAVDPKNGNIKFFTEEELKSFKGVSKQRQEFNNRKELQEMISKLGLDKTPLTKKQEFELRQLKSSAASIYNLENWRENKFYFANARAAQTTMRSINFEYNYTNMLSKHPYKITVINGMYDYVVGGKGSPIWSSFVKNEAPNVVLVILDNAGHHAWIDQPLKFRIELEKGLKD